MMFPVTNQKSTLSSLISTKGEAVLHSAHREEAPGAEEEA